MRTVGVRELKAQTSDILRRVRERGETIEGTYRGRVVARLIPVHQSPADAQDAAAVWADLDQLAAEIGALWRDDTTAAEAVREVRRDRYPGSLY